MRCSCGALFLFFALSVPVWAQNRWNGIYYNRENQVTLRLHLDEAALDVPGYAFLGKVRGYMNGGIYNIWLLTDFSERKGVLTLRMSNDSGSDTQQIQLEQLSDSLFSYRATGGNEVRKAVGRKLVKIPAAFMLTRR